MKRSLSEITFVLAATLIIGAATQARAQSDEDANSDWEAIVNSQELEERSQKGSSYTPEPDYVGHITEELTFPLFQSCPIGAAPNKPFPAEKKIKVTYPYDMSGKEWDGPFGYYTMMCLAKEIYNPADYDDCQMNRMILGVSNVEIKVHKRDEGGLFRKAEPLDPSALADKYTKFRANPTKKSMVLELYPNSKHLSSNWDAYCDHGIFEKSRPKKQNPTAYLNHLAGFPKKAVKAGAKVQSPNLTSFSQGQATKKIMEFYMNAQGGLLHNQLSLATQGPQNPADDLSQIDAWANKGASKKGVGEDFVIPGGKVNSTALNSECAAGNIPARLCNE